MLTLGQFKLQFFDRALRDATDRGAKRGLSKFGAFVRKRDKSSLKYRKQKSLPGMPPTVHRSGGFTRAKKDRKTGAVGRQPSSPLRELTFFAYDSARRSVVIGPAVFAGSKVGGGSVPRVIEEGGTSRVVNHGRVAVGRFRARPHLGPAFAAELPKLAGFLKDAIR